MNTVSKKLLLIAFEFHPCKSAGVQRPSSFSKELQKKGWNVTVLTAMSSIYDATDDSPNPVHESNIYRTKAANAAKKYSIKGKYLEIIEVPDRYWPWVFTATPVGKKIINKIKPDVILSTYPSISAHLVAYRLAKWSGLPWIADYRDPVKCHYETVPYASVSRWLDRKFVESSTKSIFTTMRAKKLYAKIHPYLDESKFSVIENGFDEDNFERVGELQTATDNVQYNKFQLLHSGAVFPPNGRSPIPLFKAISRLKANGVVSSDNFNLKFRGGPDRSEFNEIIENLNISELVEFLPSVSYLESLNEMIHSDGLLIIQGALFDNQIPGKVYEYIRSRKPILGAITKTGATADLLRTIPLAFIGDSTEELVSNLNSMLKTKGELTEIETYNYSRQERADRLHELLLECIANKK